jgi:transposase
MTPKLKARLEVARPIIETSNARRASADTIAKRLNVTRTTVTNYCRHLGINLRNKLTRNRKVTYFGWDSMVTSMRARGMNQQEIAKALGVVPSTFTKWKQTARR